MYKFDSETFIKETRPSLAVFQVGRNNYGHPSNDAIDKYENSGCKIVRNDESGAIGLIFDSNKSCEVIKMLN